MGPHAKTKEVARILGQALQDNEVNDAVGITALAYLLCYTVIDLEVDKDAFMYLIGTTFDQLQREMKANITIN